MGSAIGLLYRIILFGSPLLFVAVLIVRPRAADGSRFPRTQRWVAIATVVATVIPGVWLLASGGLGPSDGWVLLDLLVPIVLALPSVFTRVTQRTMYTAAAALMLAVCCFLAGFSIGPFYTPAAALLLVAGTIGLVPRSTH